MKGIVLRTALCGKQYFIQFLGPSNTKIHAFLREGLFHYRHFRFPSNKMASLN
jgi:hypothetical protein